MLRLRVTTGLSLLALALGIGGTGWLSTLTGVWPGPPQRYLTGAHAAPSRTPPRPRHAGHPPARVARASHRPVYRPSIDVASTPVAAPLPELVPVAMPSDNSQPWDEMRGHLDGRVVLHVEVNGDGRVTSVSLSQSSGDPVLDQHALRSARAWRFAVPADHPDGLSGELPMRFSSQGDRIARMP